MTTASSPPYLVICFYTTAGQNGENLGSDEEQIVFFVYLLYDVTNNKVSECDNGLQTRTLVKQRIGFK